MALWIITTETRCVNTSGPSRKVCASYCPSLEVYQVSAIPGAFAQISKAQLSFELVFAKTTQHLDRAAPPWDHLPLFVGFIHGEGDH